MFTGVAFQIRLNDGSLSHTAYEVHTSEALCNVVSETYRLCAGQGAKVEKVEVA